MDLKIYVIASVFNTMLAWNGPIDDNPKMSLVEELQVCMDVTKEIKKEKTKEIYDSIMPMVEAYNAYSKKEATWNDVSLECVVLAGSPNEVLATPEVNEGEE